MMQMLRWKMLKKTWMESMLAMPRAPEVLPMVLKTFCFDYLQHQEWF